MPIDPTQYIPVWAGESQQTLIVIISIAPKGSIHSFSIKKITAKFQAYISKTVRGMAFKIHVWKVIVCIFTILKCDR